MPWHFVGSQPELVTVLETGAALLNIFYWCMLICNSKVMQSKEYINAVFFFILCPGPVLAAPKECQLQNHGAYSPFFSSHCVFYVATKVHHHHIDPKCLVCTKIFSNSCFFFYCRPDEFWPEASPLSAHSVITSTSQWNLQHPFFLLFFYLVWSCKQIQSICFLYVFSSSDC